jgi:hypothetical protein
LVALLLHFTARTTPAQEDDPALLAKAKLIHSHVLKLDTHKESATVRIACPRASAAYPRSAVSLTSLRQKQKCRRTRRHAGIHLTLTNYSASDSSPVSSDNPPVYVMRASSS